MIAKKKRTQADRREATIRKLLDATTDALVEVGYAEASVQEICARAGVSHGGLFRHFPTREALMVAAAEDVGQKILERYRAEFEARRGEEPPLALSLRLIRETCRSRVNQAWYELAVAARTRPQLKKALAPLAARYYDDISRLARSLMPELALSLGPHFDVLVDTIVAIFDGEQLHRFLMRDKRADEARLDLLLILIDAALGSLAKPQSTGA